MSNNNGNSGNSNSNNNSGNNSRRIPTTNPSQRSTIEKGKSGNNNSRK